MWRSSLFLRLFATYGALGLVAIGVLGAVILQRVERHYREQIEDSLCIKALLVREAVRDWPEDKKVALQQRVAALAPEIGARITLLSDDGSVLADSERDPQQYRLENHANRPEVQAAQEHKFGIASHRHSTTLGLEMLYVALRTNGDRPGPVGYVRVAVPLHHVEQELAPLRRLVWTAVATAGLADLVLAFWLARRAALPLRELTRAAERIAAGGYGHKVYTSGHGEIAALASSFNHMSQRLADQFAQLEADRQQLRTILSGMVEGVVALDAEQRILFANERAAQLLEFQAQTAVGRKLWEVVRQRALQEVVRRALAGPEPYREELNWNGQANRSLTVHAARLPGEPVRGAVLVVHDTSELRRLERLRQEFVANVSHELKTPLSVIKAGVETLLDGAANDPRYRGPFLEQIAEQSERLHALILDLLSLARIESGAEVFEFEPVPLEPLVAACLERHRARAEAKGQRLEAVPPDSPDGMRGRGDGRVIEKLSPLSPVLPSSELAVWADAEAVSQILDNLVDNAVKYTPAGGRIAVRWRAENGQACLEVEDTGIGIPEQDLPRIFERFYRVDKARSRELGGTGLGLSIVKHLAQAMNGTVGAASRVGQGTTFSVRLPRAP
jgi:two-component system phosphate regulon sensor histidine kinase PhoR